MKCQEIQIGGYCKIDDYCSALLLSNKKARGKAERQTQGLRDRHQQSERVKETTGTFFERLREREL